MFSAAETDSDNRQFHWVDSLPPDFYCGEYAVKAPFKPALKAAEWFDLAIRSGLASLITGISIPAGYTGAKLAAVLREGSPSALMPDQEVFHQSRLVETFQVDAVRKPVGVDDGIFERIQWQSCHAALAGNPPQNNDRVVAYHWRHDHTPRPTIVVVHGFIATNWEINEFFLGMKYLYRLGCDVVLKTLPHHGPRRSSFASISGLDYVSGGIESLNQSVIQSTYDIRCLVDYLVERCGVEKVGLTGLSLGGYTTALMAGLEARLQFVMPVVPIVSIPDAMMEWKPLDRALLHIMRKFDVDMRDLRNTMAFHSPLTRAPLLPPERLMIIAGMGDRMASPRHAEALQAHWGHCALHWFEGSHVLPLQRARTNAAKKQFLQQTGFLSGI